MSYFFLSLLVLWSYWHWILCKKAHFLSVCMYVLALLDQHTLPKWNILSLLVWAQGKAMYLIRSEEKISFWEGVLVLEGQYIHMNREKMSFFTQYSVPIWAELAKKERNMTFQLNWKTLTLTGLPPKLSCFKGPFHKVH